MRAVDLFVALYGAEAGNLALRELAQGGIFVTGNIGRTLLPPRREVFLRAFRDKGRFAQLMDLAGIDYLGYGTDEWKTLSATGSGFSRGVST